MTDLIRHFINGKFSHGHGQRRGIVYNPSYGTKTKEVAFANSTDVDLAVAYAKAAQEQWAKVTPLKRARILFDFNRLIGQHRDELATLIAEEHGKVLEDAKSEVMRGKEVVEFACGAPHLLAGNFSLDVGLDIDCYSVRQALGVCAGITPFNFPVMVPLWMLSIALVCGNSFILKPSEKDPSVTNRLAELLRQAGLPDGVLNIVHGNKETVDCLLTHPHIAAVSFIGATTTARYVYETASKHGKRVQALGGAKNHCVIMPDADLNQAVNALIGAAYGSAGERCMAIAVAVVVGNATADAVVQKIVTQAKQLKVLPSLAPDAQMGPLVTEAHLQRVRGYVEQGINEGAQLLLDGRHVQVPEGDHGFFLGPCLFDQVTPNMKIYQDEIFGPVLCIMRVADFDAAVALINANAYGNGTAIFTKNGAAARRFAKEINVGMVGINVPIPVPAAFHSFGGWKDSLLGDSGMHGTEGFHFYTRLKTVTARWPHTDIEQTDFSMPTTD